MKKVLIVSALYQEIEYAESYMAKKAEWRKIEDNWFINDKNKIELFIKVLGVGKVNAAIHTTDAINDVKPDLIINVGVAGGLDDNLDVGAVVIGTDYVQVDMKTLIPENAPQINDSPYRLVNAIEQVARRKGFPYKTGRIATGDFVLYERRKRRKIKKQFTPLAFDMETAAVAQVATAKNIDFVGIRSFSDMANRRTIGRLSGIKKNNSISEEEKVRIFSRPIELVVDYIDTI